ncbi:MAG: zf-HC2 domain-containing protein [Planctomycetota bacterium]
MALPEEILDELLSAHLDGALSGDERARVEQMLESDSEVREKFEELKTQSELTSQASFIGSGLRVDFADHVVVAAIRTAVEEGCSAEHPLRLAASGQTEHSGSAGLRVAGLIAALAASVLFVVVLVQGQGRDNGESMIAGTDPLKIEKPGEKDGLAEPPQDTLVASEPESSSTPTAKEPSSELSAEPMIESVASDSTPKPVDTPIVPVPGEQSKPGEQRSTDGMVSSKPVRSLRLLLMIDVRQTEEGRKAGAVDLAMQSVEIVSGEERTIDEPLLVAITKDRTAKEKQDLDAAAERVLLLRAPSKKLDRLVNALVADRDGISSVQHKLIDNAPLLRSVESVLVDPTEVRHPASYWPIVGESEETFGMWREELAETGLPLGRDAAQAMSSVDNNGPNPMADMLLFVR